MATVNNIPQPADLMMAQYSLPFNVALAQFIAIRATRPQFNLKNFNDADIRALAQKVVVSVADEAKHGHGSIVSTVTVKLKDGRALVRRVESLKGTGAAARSARRCATSSCC